MTQFEDKVSARMATVTVNGKTVEVGDQERLNAIQARAAPAWRFRTTAGIPR